MLSWIESSIWVKYKILDPKVEDYRKRARLEILKGSPFPLFEALTPESLDAVSGMMMAQLSEAASEASEILKRRKEYAEKLGKRECSYGVEERFCPYQETFWIDKEGKTIPTSTEDLLFTCNLDKCIKEVTMK